jgi:hypothetical protein
VNSRRGRAEAHRAPPRGLGLPTVIIAQGAWVGRSGWGEVIALLQQHGLDVIAVQNPLTSLADDVDVLTRAINHRSAPIVLVGHGYAGTVITQAGNHPRVVALVYVTAFAPDDGESTADVQPEYPPPRCLEQLEIDAGGFLHLSPHGVSEFLAQDLPNADCQVLAAIQQPIRASALLDRVGKAAWRAKASWYLLAEEDRILPAERQQAIAEKILAIIVRVRASHVVFITRPKATADAILQAVEFARQRPVR